MVYMAASLVRYGADLAALHRLDRDAPALLPYATLLAARRSKGSVLGAVDAVLRVARRTPAVPRG